MLSVFVGSAVLGLFILAASSIHRNNTSGLKNIPTAHFSVPYSRLWVLSTQWRGKENRTRIDLHRRLGPVVRIGPREVSVNCIDEGVRTIYGGKMDKEASVYGALMDQTAVLFTTLRNDDHKRQKRMLSHVYSNSYVLTSQTLNSALDKVSIRLKEKMQGWASMGASVDVFQQAKCSALDIVSIWLLGAENATDTLQDPKLQSDLTVCLQHVFDTFFIRSNFRSLVPYLGKIMPSDASLAIADGRWSSWFSTATRKSYDAHFDKTSSDTTVYDHLYDSMKAADPNMSDEEAAPLVAAEVDDHLAATILGIGIVLSYTIYELSRKPESQKTLRKDILTLSEPNGQSLPYRIEDLPVLDAVITETLRTRTPGPGPFPRVVPDSGCRLAGDFAVPGGTIVSTSAWSLHYNPDIYPSPEEWRPERWLESDESTLAEMRKWFWAFGSGPRMCIGSHFAMRILRELVVAIYTDFETFVDESTSQNTEQSDSMMALPVENRLDVKFRQLR